MQNIYLLQNYSSMPPYVIEWNHKIKCFRNIFNIPYGFQGYFALQLIPKRCHDHDLVYIIYKYGNFDIHSENSVVMQTNVFALLMASGDKPSKK